MFHVRDGLFFERLNSEPGYGCGCVRIVKRESGRDDAPIVLDMILNASSWASVVASMSILGENGTTHAMIEVLQQGGRVDDRYIREQPKQR